MPEAEVLYSDVKFTKKKGDTTEAASSSLDTTYSEVKILGTQPSNEQRASQQVVSDGGSKVKSQKVALMILCILLAVVVVVLCYVSYSYTQIKQSHKNLTAKYEALEKNFTDDPCLKCDEGWKEFGGTFYYFSTIYLLWEESRRYCRSHGGDLVKIDSWEEQRFLTNKVSHKMNFPKDQFWIGLTDSKEEGKWFWVDGSPLNTSLTFWGYKEPNDSKGQNPEGEDCVRMGVKGGAEDRKCWFDKSCNKPHKFICEKQALNLTDVFQKSS